MNLGSVDGVEYPCLESNLDNVPVDNVEDMCTYIVCTDVVETPYFVFTSART